MNQGALLQALGDYEHDKEEKTDETINPIYTKGWWGWAFLTLTSLIVVWSAIATV